MEKKTESFEKYENDADKNSKIDSTQSHVFVNRAKQEHLRSTKSSPHNNLELHHTRSFSEICHLHPSHTEISFMNNICPKLKAIADLQHEVRRPESVLEMSNLTSSGSDEDSAEEDVVTTQQKGDEAMKNFLESNVSIPLEGAMTSSSLSQDTMDSDVASESELFLGNWEREGRDSVASNGSGIGKRFLTPSGQLLFREHQADSNMLDTKRLKLTPSSSERPMSPLAMRRSGGNVKCRNGGSESGSSGNEGGGNRRRYRMVSDSESEEQEDVYDLNKENIFACSVGKEDGDRKKIKKRNCDCDLRLQDLRQVVHKYEVQCEELINRSKQQYDEIKTLRKDNVNMHKEHNRLQVVIRNQNEAALNGNMAGLFKERDVTIAELRQNVQELERNLQQKTLEVTQLQRAVGSHVEKGIKYMKIVKQINNESRAFMETLAKQLGLEETFDVDNEEKSEAVLALLKTRRESLPKDFQNFFKSRDQTTDGDDIARIQDRMKQDFCQISAGYKDTISKMQKTEKGMGKILKRSASLETLLKQTKEKYMTDDFAAAQFKKMDYEAKLKELRRTNESLVRENKLLKEGCAKWKARSEEIAKQNEKDAQRKAVAKLREEKPLASELCHKLQKHLKQRRRSYSETELETLQGQWKTRSEEIAKQNQKNAQRKAVGVEKLREKKPLASEWCQKLQKYLKQRRRSCSETELETLQRQSPRFGASSKAETNSIEGASNTRNTKGRSGFEDRLKYLSGQDNCTGLGISKTKTSSTKEASNAAVGLGETNSAPKGARYMVNLKSIDETSLTKGARNTEDLKGLGDLEDRLKQLSQLTENLSRKIVKSNNHFESKAASTKMKKEDRSADRTLSALYGGELFSVIEGIYTDHLGTQQDNIHSREQECRYLREQLGVKESNEEIMQCYIGSLKRAISSCQDDLRNCKSKNQDMKKELRQLKDRVLVTNSEREMSLFYCKNNGIANRGKREDCLDVERPAQGSKGNTVELLKRRATSENR